MTSQQPPASRKQREELHREIQGVRQEILAAEADLTQRMTEIYRFEAEVDRRLGRWIDELAELEAQIASSLETVEKLREQRIFGSAYTFDQRAAPSSAEKPPTEAPQAPRPVERVDTRKELRSLYRQLARRYHPDLAVNEADRAERTQHMAAVNRAFTAGNLPELKAMLIGAKTPSLQDAQPAAGPQPAPELQRLQDELATLKRRLKQARQQIDGLHLHPSVKLSLDVKLARREGRDLLGEIARDMKKKVARKKVERDFLKSQLDQMNLEPDS
jgi:hypothetical protein